VLRGLSANYLEPLFCNAKRGANRLPVLTFFALSAEDSCLLHASFPGDAHRVRGVISKCFALSPVESYASFRGSSSSRARCTPMRRATQEKNCF